MNPIEGLFSTFGSWQAAASADANATDMMKSVGRKVVSDLGRSAPSNFWFVKNLGKFSTNLGKKASTFFKNFSEILLFYYAYKWKSVSFRKDIKQIWNQQTVYSSFVFLLVVGVDE